MCTVTYLPRANGDYILTSNRDETPKRAALAPKGYQIGNKQIYFPKDPLAGGTWIATDKARFTLVLLNGGFEKHSHKPPYRRSRGLMLLDFFAFERAESFASDYDFEGIEPFTLIILDSNKETKVSQLVWAGDKLDYKSLNNDTPYIWSSSTLYPDPVRLERKTWFDKWLKERNDFKQEEIIDFHLNGGKGDAWNDFVMDRNGEVKTVSLTSIEKSRDRIEMTHLDLLKEKGAVGTLS